MTKFFSKEEVYENIIRKNLIGVYYFISQEGKILYIGKSKNIKQRIQQHLKNGRKRLISQFFKIKIKVLNSELEALLFESQEIKKYLPVFNRRLRKIKTTMSLFEEINSQGYKYFEIRETKANSIIEFNSKKIAQKFLLRISEEFGLCDKINQLDKSSKSCFKYHLKGCQGACIELESPKLYNHRYDKGLSKIYRFPLNCELEFNEARCTTYVHIRNNRVTAFGVTNKSAYKIDYPSVDEIKIVTEYRKNTLPSILKLDQSV
tara:strand:+ start:23822 stop:24607 length:786 start_codon:yes stop_codon:yes gene_type:complete